VTNAAERVMHVPTAIEALSKRGVDPIGNSPEKFAAYLKSQIERWSSVVRAAGVRRWLSQRRP